MNALPDRVGAFSWIVKYDNMNSSRSGSRKQGLGKLLTLYFDSQVNSRKWNSTYLLAIVDKVRVLHGCFFDIIVFSFIVVFFFFPTYAQNISLCGFIRYTYVHSTYLLILKTMIKELTYYCLLTFSSYMTTIHGTIIYTIIIIICFMFMFMFVW